LARIFQDFPLSKAKRRRPPWTKQNPGLWVHARGISITVQGTANFYISQAAGAGAATAGNSGGASGCSFGRVEKKLRFDS